MHTFIVIKILPLAKNKKSDSNRAFFLYALLVKSTNNGGIQEPQPVPIRKDPSFQNNPSSSGQDACSSRKQSLHPLALMMNAELAANMFSTR
jgi:hypothetical protein